jgi:threonine/homoserine/homoserine lactone efflux protein
MTLAAFLSVALIHLVAAISPGPAFVLAVRTAATEGFRVAAALALGFGIGAALWAAAALLGLALLFSLVPPLFTALKVVGGLFLLYVAVQMWRHAREPMPVADPGAAPRGALAAVRLGALAMLANPKPAVFFGAVFVGLVPVEASGAERAVVIANILWVEAAWYVVVAWAFSRGWARAAYARAKTGLDRAMGGLIGALGARIAIG